jgi:hypothetical protein
VAKHDLEMEIPRKVVLNSDVRFVVRSNGKKIGELLVSRGSLAWMPAKSKTEYHVDWDRLADLPKQHRNWVR